MVWYCILPRMKLGSFLTLLATLLAAFSALPAMADVGTITGPMATDHRFQCYEELAPKIDPKITELSTQSDPVLKHIDVHNAFQMMALSMLAYYPADQIEGSAEALGFNTVHVFSTQEDTLPGIESNLIEALTDLSHLKLMDAFNLLHSPASKDVVYANSQVAWLENDDYVVISFRGTQFGLKANVFSDLYSVPKKTDLGEVHSGFYGSFEILWPELAKLISEMKTPKPIYLTGHSLGGALATLAMAQLFRDETAHLKEGVAIDQRSWVQGIYTFAAPQVGNDGFVNDLEASVKSIGFQNSDFSMARIENPYDVVPMIPYLPGYYAQLADPLVYFAPNGATYLGPQAMSKLPTFLEIAEQRKELAPDHQFIAYFRNIGHSLGIDVAKMDACSKM